MTEEKRGLESFEEGEKGEEGESCIIKQKLSEIMDIDTRYLKLVPGFDVHEMRNGFYSAKYFIRAGEITREKDNENHEKDTNVTMQIFQKTDGATIAGVDLVTNMLKLTIGEYKDSQRASELFQDYQNLKRKMEEDINTGNTEDQKFLFENKLAVQKELDSLWQDALDKVDIEVDIGEGQEAYKNQPVMKIRGPYKYMAIMESVYLGMLSRATKVATNAKTVVDAANGKPVLFFADRFDMFNNQPLDGYAALLGGVAGVATDAHGSFNNMEGIGTIPHALIACYDGDTKSATLSFAEKYPDVPLISLVDFENNCADTSVETAQYLHENGKKLYAVRLDTSGSMVDEGVLFDDGIMEKYFEKQEIEAFRNEYLENKQRNNVQDNTLFSKENIKKLKEKGLAGVGPDLVNLVRKKLDENGFEDVKIFVSGGFNKEKIEKFEEMRMPVDGYGVGSSLLTDAYVSDNGDFTADVVNVDDQDMGKVGRKEIQNNKNKK